MNNFFAETDLREAALTGLAVIGFIGLVSLGVWLATYASRYVPFAVGEIGAASVYLSQNLTKLFTPDGGLAVIPEATTTPSGSTAATSTKPSVPSSGVHPLPGAPTSTTTPIGGAPAQPHGLPDFTVVIKATGYLTAATTDSFVASSTIPVGSRGAVKFTIKNSGTNVSGPWRFSASLPSAAATLFESSQQQVLGPGDYIDYTMGFDAPIAGTQTISVTANYDKTVAESSSENNKDSVQVTIQ